MHRVVEAQKSNRTHGLAPVAGCVKQAEQFAGLVERQRRQRAAQTAHSSEPFEVAAAGIVALQIHEHPYQNLFGLRGRK